MSARLARFNLSVDPLVDILRSGKGTSVLSGSFVLQVLLGDYYDTSDIDIYAESVSVKCKLASYIQSRGYRLVSTEPSEYTELSGRKPSPPFLYVPKSTCDPPVTTVQPEIELERYTMGGKGKRIDLIYVTNSHKNTSVGGVIRRFYGSHVMNWWNGDAIQCVHPVATRARMIVLRRGVGKASRVVKNVEKYQSRGFKVDAYGYIPWGLTDVDWGIET